MDSSLEQEYVKQSGRSVFISCHNCTRGDYYSGFYVEWLEDEINDLRELIEELRKS